MPHLDHTGPEGKGSASGRQLGSCKNSKPSNPEQLGKGIGKRRHADKGDKQDGRGKRLQYNIK